MWRSGHSFSSDYRYSWHIVVAWNVLFAFLTGCYCGSTTLFAVFLVEFLNLLLQLFLAGGNPADGVWNFVFGSWVPPWKRSNRPLLFPRPLLPSNLNRYCFLCSERPSV